MLGLGLLLGLFGMARLGWPLWKATIGVLVFLLLPGALKWRADAKQYGLTAMVVSILLAAQGFHTVEHLVQWMQFHLFHRTDRASTGLISAANSEWIHFAWNWLVVGTLLFLLFRGLRNRWLWFLLAWALAHTAEHTYLFIRYLAVLAELHRMGITFVTAQGLPGVLGHDGWLARSVWTQGTLFCHLPGLTTAPRLDIHFWWNAGEMVFLLLAANTFMAELRLHPKE